MKVNDKNTKRRLFVAYLFRQYDNLAVGSVKMNDFPAIYARLLETNYLNAKRHKITEIIKAVDPYHKGKIEMNRFMDWISTVSRFTLFSWILTYKSFLEYSCRLNSTM